MNDAREFLAQNPVAAETLTADDVDGIAGHYCGGMVVVQGTAADGRFVKMHDTWDPEGDVITVIVHAYEDTDEADPEDDEIVEFATGREALEEFARRMRGES